MKHTAKRSGLKAILAIALLSLTALAGSSGPAWGQEFALRTEVDRETLLIGETLQLRVLLEVDGVVTGDVTTAPGMVFESLSPSVLTVTPGGLVTAIDAGTTTIVITNDSLNPDPEGFVADSFVSLRVHPAEDADGDGIEDAFELVSGLDPNDPADAELDPDADDLVNSDEFLAGTDPQNPDTDGDGFSDGAEVAGESDPLDKDSPVFGITDPKLNEECVATALNRTVQISTQGTFALGNVPVPLGAFRARIVCDRPDGAVDLAQSDFVLGVANGETPFGEIRFGADTPIPVSLALTSPALILTPSANGAQLVATGTLPDGTLVDLTLDEGTSYLSSNPAIATISPSGFVTAASSGRVLMTATHEGVITTLALQVNLAVDSDADGLPDDFEALNAVNPGGSNLSLLAGTAAAASSSSFGSGPARAIDGSLQTSWFAAFGDAANNRSAPFIEVALPQAFPVAQVRLFGNREVPEGRDIFAGILQAFDAGGLEVFNSGEVLLPGPSRDLAVPLDLSGVLRVRFTSTDDEGFTPGLSEVQIISRPGGPAFDPANPGDADADFDLDGLSNREEFELGTSPFLNDTDGDGLTDPEEAILGSSPLLADSDFDGLADGDEANPGGDRDFDGLINVLDPDADNDGLPDGVEVRLGLDPQRTDSNFNGIPDGSEDSDGDGIVNFDEIQEFTDPGNPDTDGDGLSDGEELTPGNDGVITDARRRDTDGDGMDDGFESLFGLDPLDPSDAPLDPDGDGLSNLEEFQRGTDPFNPDTAPPAVAEVVPEDGAVGAPTNGRVVVRFSEPLLASSVVPGTVQLFAGAGSVAGSLSLSEDGLSVTFTPDGALTGLTLHDLRVQGVRDRAGNRQEGAFESSFTTGNAVDTVRPTIVHRSPESGQSSVPVNVPVSLEFSERMDPATLAAPSWRVRDNEIFQDVPGTVQVDGDGRTAAFVADRPLPVGRSFTVILNSNVRDLAGNSLSGSSSFSFSTAFESDLQGPLLRAVSPGDGVSEVPVNARIVLDFGEPVSAISVHRGLTVEAGGSPVAGSFALSEGNRRVTFTSAASLAVDTLHTVTVTSGINDLAGNPLANPGSFSFRTGAVGDLTRPRVILTEPIHNTREVATDAVMSVFFDEAVNPLTVSESTFFVETDNTPVVRVAGSVVVAADARSASFTPDSPLQPDTGYRIRTFNGIHDLSGNTLSSTSIPSRFVTATVADNEGPVVEAASPPDGALDVPVNARAVLRLNEPLGLASVGPDAVVLEGPGGAVAGDVALSDDRRTLTFTPSALLLPATSYTVRLGPVRDRSGNLAGAFASGFATGVSGVADTTRPRVIAVDPTNGSPAVPVTTAITLTFDEAVDPTTVSTASAPIRIDGFTGEVPGSYAVAGSVVTFTPLAPLPGSSRVRVRADFNEIRDLAGNGTNGFSSFFDTEDQADVTPPEVVLVTPSSGAVGVGLNVDVVLTFSEPLNSTTVNGDHFGLLVNGGEASASILRSSDNRTVTLRTTSSLPPDAVVTVAATSGVEDLSGNPLADFVSSFATLAAADADRPAVVSQRPGNGGSGVPTDRSVLLFVNEPLDAATVPGAFIVSQNGEPVAGEIRVTGNGKIVELLPAQPLATDALVQVFLTSDARDLAGNQVQAYEGSFRTAGNPVDTSGRPDVARQFPAPGASGVATNTVIEVELSEPLDPATIADGVLSLRAFFSSHVITGPVSLVRDGRVIRMVPSEVLEPQTGYSFIISGSFRDLDGQTPPFSSRVTGFTTGPGPEPVVAAVEILSPQQGAEGVGTNALMRVRFDAPINPLSVAPGTVEVADADGTLVTCSLGFDQGNRLVRMVPHAPLTPGSLHTLTIRGVEDQAGRSVAPVSVQFTAGAEPDTVPPKIVAKVPFDNAVDVPVNTVVTLEVDEPVDPTTVSSDSLRVREEAGFTFLPGSRMVDGGARRVSFVGDDPLPVGRRLRVFFSNDGIEDLAGNRLTGSDYTFTASFEADLAAPRIVDISPGDGLSEVPINSWVIVQLDEPIQGGSALAGSTLTGPLGAVELLRTLSDASRRLILKPRVPLAPETAYTLEVDGLADLAGNLLAAPTTVVFSTGPGADLDRPSVVLTDPLNGAVEVPTNALVRVLFDERVAPLTVTTGDLFVETDLAPVVRVEGSVAVSTDQKSATFIPAAPLAPSTRYRLRAFNGIADLTGQTLDSSSIPTRFTTGEAGDLAAPVVRQVSPPAGSTGVPVNARVVLGIDEPLSVVAPTGSITLASAGGAVSGSLSFSSDRRVLTFTPDLPLDPSTSYSVSAGGLVDLAGNPMAAFASDFTTSASATADTARPRVLSVSPANNALGVAVDTSIVLTFDEALDPTSVDVGSVPIRIDGIAGEVPGTYLVQSAVVTFTPLTPLPGNRRVRVRVDFNEVRDLAGNGTNPFSSLFDTATVDDVTAPTVVLVTPADGAVEIGLNPRVVITFSEALDPGAIGNSTFGLLAAGFELGISVLRSTDNRTVTLSPNGSLPAGSEITVAVTSGVTDLSGNPLPALLSRFTTLSAIDTGRPSVVNQRPGNGANGVPRDRSIVLFVDEPVDPATVAGAFRASQEGALVAATVTVSADGQILELVPAQPWQGGALIQVFLTEDAKDLSGNSAVRYEGSFRVAAEVVPGSTAGISPSIVARSPPLGSGVAPRNPVMDVVFSEPLDPTSVSAVTLALEGGGVTLTGPVTLVGDRVLRMVPEGLLPAQILAGHSVDVSGLRDLDGDAAFFHQHSCCFQTTDEVDETAPLAQLSPPSGAVDIPVNARIRVAFNERLNPLFINEESFQLSNGQGNLVSCSFSVTDGDRTVVMVPHAPLAPASEHTLTVSGVEDLAGHPVTPTTVVFTTGEGPDLSRPAVVARSPLANATEVPVNARVVLELSEPVDPLSVTSTSFFLRDESTFQAVPDSSSLSADGRILDFLPDAPLAASRTFRLFYSNRGVTDFVGNRLIGAESVFTTSADSDAAPPQVLRVSPQDGLADLPVNVRVSAQLGERVQGGSSLAGAGLKGPGGVEVPVERQLLDADRRLILRPQVSLAPLTDYTATLSGLTDLAGNVLALPVVVSFTTGAEADLASPTQVGIFPLNNAVDVPLDVEIRVEFSERMDPVTVTESQLFVETDFLPIVRVPGSTTLAADGLSATYTLSEPLQPGRRYRIRLFSGLTDLAGQAFSGSNLPVRFTTVSTP